MAELIYTNPLTNNKLNDNTNNIKNILSSTTLTPNDIVFKQSGGNIIGGGYLINNFLLNDTLHKIQNAGNNNQTYLAGVFDDDKLPVPNDNCQTGGKKKSPKRKIINESSSNKHFEDLMIPTGIFLFSNPLLCKTTCIRQKYISNNNDDFIDEDLYDKLLHIVSPSSRKNLDSKTRKNKLNNKLKIKNDNKSRKLKLKIHQ